MTSTYRTLFAKHSILALFFTLVLLSACGQQGAPAEKVEDEEQQVEARETFTVVELAPSFEGGMPALFKYVATEIKYPLAARKAGVEGEVDASFVIERNGNISNVKIEKGISAECDQEVKRIIAAANGFKPGQQRGRTVRTTMSLPVTFKIQEGKTNPDGSAQGAIIVGELAVKPFQLQVDSKYSNGQWSGTIKDQQGNPMPGCSIVLEGTSFGTVSNLQGTFEIKASKDQVLHISYVGAESKRISN